MTVRPLVRAAVSLLVVLAPLHAQGAADTADTRTALRDAAALRDQGRHAEAAEAFAAIVEASPSLAAARFQLAYCVHAEGDHERAIALHRAAAGFPQVRAAALYNLACALAMTGRGDEALDALRDAVNAGFSDASLARSDAELASLRDEPRFDEILSYTATPARDALAFWVGEWDCYGAASRALNGHNRLEARLDGKAILEQWRPAAGTGGARGESWNWFDGTSGHWRQTWIDANGAVVEFVGRRQGAGILFEAEVDAGGGATQLRRMLVRPVDAPPGLEGERRVRQTGTLSNDGGATWQPNYDLVYVPKGRPLDGSAGGEARTDPTRR